MVQIGEDYMNIVNSAVCKVSKIIHCLIHCAESSFLSIKKSPMRDTRSMCPPILAHYFTSPSDNDNFKFHITG